MIEFGWIANFTSRYESILKNREYRNRNEAILPIYGVIQESGGNAIQQLISMKCKKRKDGAYLLFDNKSENEQSLIKLFLNDTNLDWNFLEIQGSKGSGKKTLARLVEEYVWEYSKNPQIPILVDIKNFQEPQNMNLDSILKQFPYEFNDEQIKDVKNQRIQFILVILPFLSEHENEIIIELKHKLSKERINCKVIRFIYSYTKFFRLSNFITVELVSFTDNQICNYLNIMSHKNVHQSLLQLYLDLKLDQKELETFRQNISFLLMEGESNQNICSELRICKIISDLKSQIETENDVIEHAKQTINSFLSYQKVINIFKDLVLYQMLKIPYLLFIFSKFYPKLYDENSNANIELFKKIFELYYLYEKLYQNQLNERNISYKFMNEIVKQNCEQIIYETEEYGKQKNSDVTFVQIIQKNSQFNSFIKCYAWAEYLNSLIMVVRKMTNNLIGNALMDSRQKNEKIFNDLLSTLVSGPLVSCNISNLQFSYNSDFHLELFKKQKEDKQTLIYLYLLMQDQLKESQIFANIKTLVLFYFCPTISVDTILITQSKQYSSKSYYETYFQNYQNSSVELKLKTLNTQIKKQWNLYSGELLNFSKVEKNAEFKIWSNHYIKQFYFKKQNVLYIIPEAFILTAISKFGPFMAMTDFKWSQFIESQVMLRNIRNQKVIRTLAINIKSLSLSLSLSLSQDCQYLAACSGKTIFLWNIQAQLIEKAFNFDTSILAIQFFSGTKLLVIAIDLSIYRFDLVLQESISFPNQKQIKLILIDTLAIIPSIVSLKFTNIKLVQSDAQVLAQIEQNKHNYSYLIDFEDLEYPQIGDQLRDIEKSNLDKSVKKAIYNQFTIAIRYTDQIWLVIYKQEKVDKLFMMS